MEDIFCTTYLICHSENNPHSYIKKNVTKPRIALYIVLLVQFLCNKVYYYLIRSN